MKSQALSFVDVEALGSLVQVDQSARALARDDFQRTVQHLLAIAQRSAKDVAGQAMGVHADQHRIAGEFDVSLDQGNVRVAVELASKAIMRNSPWRVGSWLRSRGPGYRYPCDSG